MKRLTLMGVVWLSFVTVATASLAPPRKSALFGKETPAALASKISPLVFQRVLQPESEPEFAVTAQTEILLDGKPCAYRDVPASAGILRMEVAPDRKTVRKIHFRSGK